MRFLKIQREIFQTQYNIKNITMVSILGFAYFILAILFQSMITNPLAVGFSKIFLAAFLFSLCCLLARKFGAATIMGFIFGLLVIPFPILGPSGFLPKIIITTLTGFVVDFVHLFLKEKGIITALATGVTAALSIIFFYLWITTLFGKLESPDINVTLFLKKLLPGRIIPSGLIGGCVGYLTYKAFKPIIHKLE